MNIKPKSGKPIIKRLRETAADLLSEKTYIACAGCDNHNSAEVGKDIRWALREIKRLNTLLSGLYATAQAKHDALSNTMVSEPGPNAPQSSGPAQTTSTCPGSL